MKKETVSAGGIIVRLNDKNIYEVLLLRDKDYDDWITAKGHREEGETIEEAAYREVYEEGGIVDVEILTLLGSFRRYNEKSNENKTIYYYLMQWGSSSKIVESEENGKFEIRWHNIEELPKMFLEEQGIIIRDNLEIIKRLIGKNPNNVC